jgi:hypothetical protein
MNEFDELKSKLKEIGGISGRLAKTLWLRLDTLLAKKIPDKTTRLVLVFVVLSFCSGIVFSAAVSGLGGLTKGEGQSHGPSFLKNMSLLRFFFAPTMRVAGRQDDGSRPTISKYGPCVRRNWFCPPATSPRESRGRRPPFTGMWSQAL